MVRLARAFSKVFDLVVLDCDLTAEEIVFTFEQLNIRVRSRLFANSRELFAAGRCVFAAVRRGSL